MKWNPGHSAVRRDDCRAFDCRRPCALAGAPGLRCAASGLRLLGARRWVMPLEMSCAALSHMLAAKPAAMETEVFAYGRMPLAFSARCFTARHYNLPKDDCQFRCLDYPDGLRLTTREGQDFLVLNGIQTMSAGVYNLVNELGAMRDMGVDIVRLSPQAFHTPRIVKLFRECLEGQTAPQAALEQMKKLMPSAAVDGYWYGKPGIEQASS